MFGPVNYKDAPVELCYSNCPRIFPRIDELLRQRAEDAAAAASQAQLIPVEYQSVAGKRLYLDRLKPCYLLIRLTRPHCRALRNYIIANSSKLAVIKGNYCGISTKVFNIKTGFLHPTLAMGLLRFASTEQAYRFVTDEHKMAGSEFLGGRFDIWNLTLESPDRSIVPNPVQPSKFVNAMNVFHFVHVKELALVPDNASDVPHEVRQAAILASADLQVRLEQNLAQVSSYGGSVVVKATGTMARIRGMPLHSPATEPHKTVFMSQWPGVHQFWRWYDSPAGVQFSQDMKEFAGGSYESLLFTVCLDFNDLGLS